MKKTKKLVSHSNQDKTAKKIKKPKAVVPSPKLKVDSVIINDLIAQTPNLIILVDNSGTCLFLNPKAKKVFGTITAGELKIRQIIGEMSNRQLRECISSGKPCDFFIERNGKSFHFYVRGLLHSNLAAFYGIDVTDLIKIEADLVKSQNILRRVLDTDPNMIFVKDADGRFILGNQAIADTYGTTIENLIGKTDLDFNPNSSEIEKYLKDDMYVIKNKAEVRIEEEAVSDLNGNTRYFATVKRPLQFGPGTEVYVLGVSTDISSLKNLQEKYAQATKMEALGQLAGGIAHDFNNLLTAIMGHAEILKITYPSDENVQKPVAMIKVAADRAKILTEQLLGFARKGKREDSLIDLHTLISDTLALLRRTIDPSIQLISDLNAESSFIRGDPVQIQQVIMNLAINARDALLHAPKGFLPKIEVSTSNHNTSGRKPETVVDMIFADNGSGMSEVVKRRIFEPFFTTKEVGKGTGLGLSTVYGIVINHGGEIKVESKEGAGARFFISFPAFQGKRKEPVNLNPKDIKCFDGGEVLLVDDHEDVLGAVSAMLQSMGMKVKACTSGPAAIKELTAASNNYCLSLVDMVMPEMGGTETIRELRKINPMLPVLIISGYSNDKATQRLISQGIPFLRKPFDLDALKKGISEAILSVRNAAR